MLEEFKEEAIVNKLGGRFKLSSLIQKRMVALNRGARPLVDVPTKNLMQIVVAEIMADKIYLDQEGEFAIREETPEAIPISDGGPDLDDLE
ncbi:DNA-directed RNA polymerase subunit omega [Thalassoroseus pseudoceratinae]|uniref:DNA-directed RNA polymerase subunit omega n=1 Tax=Thalassoroseus pseudoceratinae TaxID=2713176 RepID=UPI0014222BD8|nr:DNA-directed RNA polymerase subunit omega [Thalassoroseus pseudoceratinae]